jgi:competence protein ComEC
LRWGGLAGILAGFMVWQGADRPDVLISDQGTLVGWMTSQGRALSREKGAGFAARNWLENDGDGAVQADAAARWARPPVLHLSGKRAVAAFGGCDDGQIIVSSIKEPDLMPHNCLLFEPKRLAQTGSVALNQTNRGWEITTARDVAGTRLWTHWPKAEN